MGEDSAIGLPLSCASAPEDQIWTKLELDSTAWAAARVERLPGQDHADGDAEQYGRKTGT